MERSNTVTGGLSQCVGVCVAWDLSPPGFQCFKHSQCFRCLESGWPVKNINIFRTSQTLEAWRGQISGLEGGPSVQELTWPYIWALQVFVCYNTSHSEESNMIYRLPCCSKQSMKREFTIRGWLGSTAAAPHSTWSHCFTLPCVCLIAYYVVLPYSLKCFQRAV